MSDQEEVTTPVVTDLGRVVLNMGDSAESSREVDPDAVPSE